MRKQNHLLLVLLLVCCLIFVGAACVAVRYACNLWLLLIPGALSLMAVVILLLTSSPEKTKVRIINRSRNELPGYATPASAGMDLRASLDEPIVIAPGKKAFVPTGLFMELPVGFEAQIRPRSGLAAKNAITVLNAPGTIDADYRGEIKVILINLSQEDFKVENGDRIAQMVIARHETIHWKACSELSDTERGAGGFGHTGKK